MAKYYEQLRNVDGDISDRMIVDEHGSEVTKFEDGDILVLAVMPYDWLDFNNKCHHATGEAEYLGGKWYVTFQ